MDQFSSTVPLINPSPINSKIYCSGASSLSTDILNNERPSSLLSSYTKLSSVTPESNTTNHQTKSSTETFTASSIDHYCRIGTVARLDPTNSSRLNPTNSSFL